MLRIKVIINHKFSRQKSLPREKSLAINNVFASLAFLLQSIWLEEGHVLVNPSHMLVHVRAVLRLVHAVDASEVAFLAMITAKSLMPHCGVLRRETVGDGRTGAMGKPAIAVGHGSTWKNCHKIRRIKQTADLSSHLSLQRSHKSTPRYFKNTHMWFRQTWPQPLIWKIYLSLLQENICNLRDIKRKHKKQIYIRIREHHRHTFKNICFQGWNNV